MKECYYEQNREFTYITSSYYEENSFKNAHTEILPAFKNVKNDLPVPVWDGHDNEIECYYKAWEIAFGNLRNPAEDSGFVSPFIDTAFNGNLFMWDSCFILMFCKYAAHIFNFQQTLDNFYAKQHKDGYICRELREEDGKDRFTRFDPASTGPNIMPWCEWEYYTVFKDKERLKRVFPCLLAYHKWLKDNHTWRDGSYWSSSFGCGMDNIKSRMPLGTNLLFSNAHMVWADVNFQQIFSGKILLETAKIIGRENEELVAEIAEETKHLERLVNEKLWDGKTNYYYDLWRDGRLNYAKTVGSYWALAADAVPKDRLAPFIAHLDNKNEFKRPHRVPTVSADDKNYTPTGGYWNGAVWAPTNYMVLKGLDKNGYNDLAYDIALNHLENVAKVFKKTGTVWENYAPEYIEKGSNSRPDFVGWTGLVPIAVFFEYVLGIRANPENNSISWHVNRTERHGIMQYPLGSGGNVDLICEKRSDENEKPVIRINSDKSVTVEVFWKNGHEIIKSE